MKSRRVPKKSKKEAKVKRQPVTQAEFYEEGTAAEEQAERWLLSDVRRSLRAYVEAFALYEAGLANGTEGSVSLAYDIAYNETRLLLQIHTDYVANDGWIDLLQFVRLDDIPGVGEVLRPLPEIVQKLEQIRAQHLGSLDVDMWDLECNILTAYLSLVESNERYGVHGADLLVLADKFVELSQYIVKKQIDELESWEGGNPPEDSAALVRDTLDEQAGQASRDGSGIVTNAANDPSRGEPETMDVSDQITTESLTEVLLDCYKFAQALLEILVQQSSTESNSNPLNIVQVNYLADTADKLSRTVDDIVSTVSRTIPVDLSEISLAQFGVAGARTLLQGDLGAFDAWLASDTGENATLDMVKLDALEFSLDSGAPQGDAAVEWVLASALAKKCSGVGARLGALRTELLTTGQFDQARNAQLSHTVFQLCSVYVTGSDNDLRRYVLKQREANGEETARVSGILLRNAQVLLSNVATIASKSCGMQETVVDKLRRNYVHQQGTARLQLLAAGTSEAAQPPDLTAPLFRDQAIQDLLADHPFYSQLA